MIWILVDGVAMVDSSAKEEQPVDVCVMGDDGLSDVWSTQRTRSLRRISSPTYLLSKIGSSEGRHNWRRPGEILEVSQSAGWMREGEGNSQLKPTRARASK